MGFRIEDSDSSAKSVDVNTVSDFEDVGHVVTDQHYWEAALLHVEYQLKDNGPRKVCTPFSAGR